MTFVNLESLAQLSAERILNCAAEGAVIALLAWLVLRAIGRQNSGTRFAVWFAALLGIAALPFFGFTHAAAKGSELARPSEFTMPGSWALYIFAAWSTIAAAGLLRVGIGFGHLHRLRKSCVPVVVATLDPLLQKTLAEFDSPRAVELCVSDRLPVPTALGFMKPIVAIPSWTMRELSASELNAILLHELAHLRRRDDWTNLIQKVVGALLFFHPAVWWIEKKLTLEREMACDDLVLARTTNARAYAECLVSMAEKSFLRRGLALAQAAVGRLRHVTLRVAQILDVNRPQATRVWSPAPVLVGGVSLLCLVGLSQAPTRLVSFENSATAVATSPSGTNGASSDFDAPYMGAHVVPAKLSIQTFSGAPERQSSYPIMVKSAAKSAAKSAIEPQEEKERGKSEVVPGGALRRRAKTPMLVRTSLTANALAPRTLVFVTRTEFVETQGYDSTGAVVWNVYVWQVTVVGIQNQPVQNKMEAGIAAKSI